MKNWTLKETWNAVFPVTKKEEAKHADSDRVAQNMQSKYALVESLSPSLISTTLLTLMRGDPRSFAILWRDIKLRDDLIPSLEEKRIKAIARQEWEIAIAGEETPIATKQKEALEYFFEHLIYTDCLNRDMIGGFSGLIKGMMQSIGYGWSVQEIVWSPSPAGLTATFIQIPLECFKQYRGKLEFLETEGAIRGLSLETTEWLCSAYPTPLGVASLVLYYYKRLPLKDWLVYCKRFVVPALHGKTSASKDSDEWNDLRSALANFGMDYAILTGKDVEVDTLSKSAGSLPYPQLVERCDRSLSTLWRGGDLSTMAKDGQAVGSNMQKSEAEILVDDDSCFIEDIINNKLVPAILANVFGAGVKPEVYFQFSTSGSSFTQDLAVDQKFFDWEIPMAVSDLRQRYNRPAPADGDEITKIIAKPTVPQFGLPNSAVLAPERHGRIDREKLYLALDKDLEPIRKRVEVILQLPDAEMVNQLKELARSVPTLFKLLQENVAFQNALEVEVASTWGDAFTKGQEV